ncbi:amidase domain-containing protein [Planctomonas sp. JC2975]|uniref:amidase domain-containing protein n=1 Tax=Planctomonas sp. JC2975 TaxID=2729626 RepID=UPI0014751550|nr:amidase domain-containing protein [Planctomonas sp. JC2975]NNC12809.1 amidase domain-containing protein [Planctomonas sp. JC2975]
MAEITRTKRRRWRAASAVSVIAVLALAGCSAGPAPLPEPIAKQYDYAMAHWNDYNTKVYGDLNPVGGDCANFVSQTLIARGWKMNDQWYNHDAAADWSPAWGYVPAMDNYFAANAKTLGLTEYPLDKRSKIAVGDIVVFSWEGTDSYDHVEIVSKVIDTTVDGKKHIEIKMAGHNKDTKYRDLDYVVDTEYKQASGHFWHVALPPTASPTPTK